MLMRQAVDIINTQMGFMVSFEHKEGCMLLSDYFPEKHFGEELIPTEEEAWVLAKKFAAKTVGRCVNVYVVAHDFSPVPGYEARRIDNRNGAKMKAESGVYRLTASLRNLPRRLSDSPGQCR